MRLSRTSIQVFRGRARVRRPAGVRASVSLHSHSCCSREKLDFLPGFARRLPLVAPLLDRSLAEYQRQNGRALDFSKVYWRPPLPPAAVIASEREQLERCFDSPAFVSLTDHDTVEGPKALRAGGQRDVPLSFEWSVPFAKTVFHLGVHAISPGCLDQVATALAGYTAGEPYDLGELLDALCESPETFVILNHPYWDLSSAGQLQHDSTLLAFLRAHRDRVHGLELNGYRTWSENRRVLPLAEGFGLPVVGGGDRHGYAPNTIVNLTRASSLAEFAHELRVEQATHCVVFPEYAEPYVVRVLGTACDILRPEARSDRSTWAERVFIATDGVEQSVDSMWERAPRWIAGAVAFTRLLGSGPLRPLFELRRSDGHETLEADCMPETILDSVPSLAAPGSAAVV